MARCGPWTVSAPARKHPDLPLGGWISGVAARGGRRPPGAWPDSNGAVIPEFSDAQYQRWALSRLASNGT